jgi:hypothetical protein
MFCHCVAAGGVKAVHGSAPPVLHVPRATRGAHGRAGERPGPGPAPHPPVQAPRGRDTPGAEGAHRVPEPQEGHAGK